MSSEQPPHHRPTCPRCGAEMWLKMSERLEPGQDSRSYRCPSCGAESTGPSESGIREDAPGKVHTPGDDG